jgi:hypothetical protein
VARHRHSSSVKEPGVRPFVLDDATGAPKPGTARADDTAAAAEPPTLRLDARVARWLEERERFERRRRSAAGSPPTTTPDSTPNP